MYLHIFVCIFGLPKGIFANSIGNAPYLLGSLLPSGSCDFLLNVNLEADLLQVSDWEVVLPLPQRLNLVGKIFGLSWSLHTSNENLSFIYCIDLYETYSNILLSKLFLLFISNFLFKDFVFNISKFVPRSVIIL